MRVGIRAEVVGIQRKTKCQKQRTDWAWQDVGDQTQTREESDTPVLAPGNECLSCECWLQAHKGPAVLGSVERAVGEPSGKKV